MFAGARLGLHPRDLRDLDGEELEALFLGARYRERERETAIASLRSDMRSLWGSQTWTIAQMLGEQPPPIAAGDVGAIERLVSTADALRDERGREEAEGWADELDHALMSDNDDDVDMGMN